MKAIDKSNTRLPKPKHFDRLAGPLNEGDMGFLLMGNDGASIWYVLQGPCELWVCRAAEKEFRRVGWTTRVVRFTVMTIDVPENTY